MKKKIMLTTAAIVLCTVLLVSSMSFAGDGFSRLPGPSGAENLAVTKLENICDSRERASAQKAVDGDTNTVWKSSETTDALVLTFREEQSFNTIILREKGWNVKKFRLSYYAGESGNGRWERFYEQDSIEDYRYCAFDTVTARQIKLEIMEADSAFKIREFEVYNSGKKEMNQFRVSDYVETAKLKSGVLFDPESEEYFSPEHCAVINQIHVIPAAKWNDNGELVLTEQLSGEELKACVQRLRDYYGSREVEIFATVFFNNCNPDTVLTQCKETVIENTVQFLRDYGFDGVSYDWEYPNQKQWALFSAHLISLKNTLSRYDLKLSCAVFPWTFDMSTEAINALDQIEIMAYDNFDDNGNHSSFNSGAVQPVQYFLEKGFQAEQINLGLPFYARPQDGSGVWVDYDDAAYTPADRFRNYSDGMWFSGVQMTMDKTAYAIENQLGGMMIFTSVADLPYESELSLLKSLKTTIDLRTTLNNAKEQAKGDAK